MADLKLLTERVVEKEKTTLRQSVEEKKKNSEDEIQAASARAEQEKQEQKAVIDEELQQEYTIRKNTLDVQKRNDVLAHKQQILSKILADTKEQLKQVDQETFRTFLSDVLKQFEGQGEVGLVLGEQTQGLVDQDWLSQQNFSDLRITLNDETEQNEAGVIVQKDGIDYNFLFDELVDDMRTNLLPEISKELFN